MITRKIIARNHIVSDIYTLQMRSAKRYRKLKYLNIISTILVITYIITVLTKCAEANESRHWPHRPEPGWSGNPILSTENQTEAPNITYDDMVSVVETEPTEETTFETTFDTTMLPQDVDVIEADAEANEDYADKDEANEEIYDENYKHNYPNDGEDHQGQRTDEEELNEMIEGLGKLLSNESAIVTIDAVSDAFDQMDTLLATEDDTLEFPCTVLTALDALGARADLNGSTHVATARRNVAVVMADSAPEHPVRGLRIAAAQYGFSEENLQILEDGVDPSTLTSEDTEAAVNLPASLSESSRRISFVVFGSDRAFLRHDRDLYLVNSKVISVNVENFTKMEEGEVIDVHLKPSVYQPARNMSRACAYWHFTDNGTGYWSQEGCIFIKSASGLLDTCRCVHLTHFAEVLVPKVVFSEENETALQIISLIGCFLSLFGLIIIGITAIVFRSWRSDFNNKIWLQLTIALLLNVISFLTIVFAKFDDYSMVCTIVGVVLHYAVLASFCWMLVAAVISYRKLVLVFARDPRRRLLKASAFSWLFPMAVVGLLIAVAPQSYSKAFERQTPNGAFCYPSGLSLWLSVYLPIALVVISNWIIFILIIRSVFCTKKIQKHGDSSEMIRRASVSCLLVFLFGLPWIFGLFAYNIVAAYLFVLSTSYQGFVLFLFFIVINTKTRGMWMTKLRIRQKAKAVSSSLITSRNAPGSDEAEQSPFIEPSSIKTNVTSLVSNSSDGRAVAFNATSGSAVIEDSKDSDIDSFKTARSHDNFTDDEIYKSMDGIADAIEENSGMQPESGPSTESNSSDSQDTSKTLTINNDITNRNSQIVEDIIMPKTVEGELKSMPVTNLKDDDVPSNEDHISRNSSQKVDVDDEFISPNITVYSVPTQSAPLIS